MSSSKLFSIQKLVELFVICVGFALHDIIALDLDSYRNYIYNQYLNSLSRMLIPVQYFFPYVAGGEILFLSLICIFLLQVSVLLSY